MANALLPEFDELPAAGTLDHAAQAVENVMAWRPDLAADLRRALQRANGMPADAAWDCLETEDPEAFAALRLAILGGYYTNDRVMATIGYAGQPSQPLDEQQPLDFIVAGRLDPVRQRGHKWRNPADACEHSPVEGLSPRNDRDR
jgi:hypothetical protein